jgi:hypothetical protein
MNEAQGLLSGPDFAKGIPLSEVADGAMLLGHARGEPLVLTPEQPSVHPHPKNRKDHGPNGD